MENPPSPWSGRGSSSESDSEQEEPVSSTSSLLPSALRTLRQLTSPKPPALAECLRALSWAEGGMHEKSALDEVVRAARLVAVPDELRAEAGKILLARGDTDTLLSLVSETSTSCLRLRAEAFLVRGDKLMACSTLERILAQDIQAAGVRQRLEALRRSLGTQRLTSSDFLEQSTLLRPAPVSPFRILAEVARGGTATIFQAEDESLGRPLALKMYHQVEQSREQVAQEARVASRLMGKGVIRVYDASPEDGWLALEWLHRGSIRDFLTRGAVSELLPLQGWLFPLVRSLAMVHETGWVHGDIKPANVLFRTLEEPIVTDFGLSKRQGEVFQGGSIGYMSPERRAGQPADPRDDVFSIGRLLEEVVRGAPSTAGLQAVLDLAQRCKGPLAKRPAHGTALLHLMEERLSAKKLRKKTIVYQNSTGSQTEAG
jgi:eukaryotic-like serine/threonine-protein kinase